MQGPGGWPVLAGAVGELGSGQSFGVGRYQATWMIPMISCTSYIQCTSWLWLTAHRGSVASAHSTPSPVCYVCAVPQFLSVCRVWSSASLRVIGEWVSFQCWIECPVVGLIPPPAGGVPASPAGRAAVRPECCPRVMRARRGSRCSPVCGTCPAGRWPRTRACAGAGSRRGWNGKHGGGLSGGRAWVMIPEQSKTQTEMWGWSLRGG